MIKRDSPITMYHQVRQDLERQILETGLRVGDRLPSVRELTDSYQVSLPVIRQAIAELAKDGIVRVEHGRGSFVARLPLAANPAGASTILFLSCSHELFDPYYARVLHGVQTALAPHELQLVYAHPTDQRPLERLLDSAAPLGVILAGEVDAATLSSVEARGLPFVVAGDMAGPGLPDAVNWVANDDGDGGYQVGEHLMTQGHRRVGVIAGSQELPFWRHRLEGFRRALADHGVELEDRYVTFVAKDRPGEGATAAARLLRQDPPPTAIFASNDRYAYGVYAYLLNHSRRIPEHCSLVGFDDLELSVELAPPLTTVHLDIERVGTRAATMLLDLIANPTQAAIHEKLPVSLIVRGSVQPAHSMVASSHGPA